MKFSISRTSIWSDKCPLEGCNKVEVNQYIDERTFKNKEEWLERFPADAEEAVCWGTTSDGNPFRVIIRNNALWTKDFNTLEEIMVFVKQQGECIISENSHTQYVDSPKLDGHIEIYDSYRE